MSKVKAQIDAAFYELSRACDSSTVADRWLSAAVAAEERSEREHRAMGARFTGQHARAMYRESVQTAARYFVVKWSFEHKPGKKTTYQAVARIRAGAMLACSVREQLAQEKRWPFGKANPLEGLDYTTDIARRS